MAVRQMPLVVEAGDDAAADEAAVRCYRDVLGLPVELALDSEGGARVTIMEAGRAALDRQPGAAADDRRGGGPEAGQASGRTNTVSGRSGSG